MHRAISAALLLILTTTACGGSQPMLRMEGDNKVGMSLEDTPYGQPRSIGSIPVCVTEEGTAIITDVVLHEATGDIQVDAFAVRPSPFARGLSAVGNDGRTLAEIGDGFVPDAVQQVDVVCPTPAQMDDESVTSQIPEFAVQVSWSSGDLAGGTAIDVTYEINGSRHTATIPVAVWLCAATCPADLPNGGVGIQ